MWKMTTPDVGDTSKHMGEILDELTRQIGCG